MSKGEVVSIGIDAPTAVVVFDKPRTLKLNIAAQIHAKRGIRELRKLAGSTESEVSDFEVFAGGAEASAALVWGCLMHEDPDLEVATVAGWLHPGNTQQISDVLARMIEAYRPDLREGDAPLAEKEEAAA